MKKLIPFSLIIITFLLSSCRKKELKDVSLEPPKTIIEHCTDGILADGEQDIDCGGDCDPCNWSLSPSCATTQNSFTIDGVEKFGSYVGCNQFNSYYTISSGPVEISLGVMPTEDRVYYVSQKPSLEYGDAKAKVFWGLSGYYYMTEGIIYASVDNGIITISICDSEFKHSYTGDLATGKGSLTCS